MGCSGLNCLDELFYGGSQSKYMMAIDENGNTILKLRPDPVSEQKFNKEYSRTDIKILEKLTTEKYKPKPPTKKKFELDTSKKIRPITGRTKRLLKYNQEMRNVYIFDMKNNLYGINYSYDENKNFIDVYNIENEQFLYRIKPIEGQTKIYLTALNDGTFLAKGSNKSYIIYIDGDKGYQILYETDMSGYSFLLHDDRIIAYHSIKDKNQLKLYEKDENGILRKPKKPN